MKIKLEREQRVYFTSDTHYNHSGICAATTKWINPTVSRKFDSLEHMNSTLVNNINEVVGQDDILFHLGDWSFGGFEYVSELRNRIICKNVHIITGNHDYHIDTNRSNCQSLFSSVNKYLELIIDYNTTASELNLVLMHFPIASWKKLSDGVVHLHGHTHLPMHKRIGKGKMMDVGCDGNNLKPISLKEIISYMNDQPIKSMVDFDYHEKSEKYKS